MQSWGGRIGIQRAARRHAHYEQNGNGQKDLSVHAFSSLEHQAIVQG
jgi:hypothetical protein